MASYWRSGLCTSRTGPNSPRAIILCVRGRMDGSAIWPASFSAVTCSWRAGGELPSSVHG
jgi:hypothetical protein